MSLIRVLKRFFLKEKREKKFVRLHEVSNGQLLGRLQRGMPLEHITCDEYVPVPKEEIHFHGLKLTEQIKEPEEKIAKVKITRKKKLPYPQSNDSCAGTVSVGDFKQVPIANNYISGFTVNLLKEALEDAKAVKETAKINAKMAMEEAFGKAFKKNQKYVINNVAIKPVILPPKNIENDLDNFDLNKIFAQRRVKVYDDEKW